MAGELELVMAFVALVISIVATILSRRRMSLMERMLIASRPMPSLRKSMMMEEPLEPIEEIQQPRRGRPRIQEPQTGFDKTKVLNLLEQIINEIQQM